MVVMPGGDLQVSIGADGNVEQIGWVQELRHGAIASDLLAALT